MAKLRAKVDLAIIGGGIVGLATARQAAIRHPKLKLCVIEKEQELALHQTKRNSGVVHSGIYYKRGSLKSKFCIKGAQLVKDYCQTKNLPYNQCGKLVVATQEHQLPVLHNLFENATSNRIKDIKLLSTSQIASIQPGCSNAIEAIWSPNTAIVDWHKIALSYADDLKQKGGEIITDFTAFDMKPNVNSLHIEDAKSGDIIEARSVVNCAGLFSDYFARRTGNDEHPKVVPFKGNYYILSDRLSQSIKTNIYPVPDPKVPFLGVHITPRVDGSVLVGPTALVALSYENYNDRDKNDSTIKLSHLYHIFIRSGLKKMLKNRDYLKAGAMELWRHMSKERFAREVRELLPDLKAKDLIDTNFCGIRAQVVGKRGDLVDDFLFETGLNPEYNRVLHLRNCPSPAATSSLAIAERVVDILEERLI